jgi:lipoyl(octanoyl) transferase
MGTGLRPLDWSWLGRVGYAEAVALQESTRDEIRAGCRGDRLLLLEHPPVYTLGRNAVTADVTAPVEWLASRGIEVFEADRGGQVTYHGPGQLVGYPVVDLSPDRQDVRRYVRGLQEVLVRVLGDFGLEAEGRREQPEIGVWVGNAKVASLGIHIKRWITTHGFALNVTTDLSHFAGIVPCGLAGVRMASIESLTGQRPDLEHVARMCVGHFRQVLGYELESVAVQRRASPRGVTG